MFCARKTVAIASSRVFVQPLAVVGRRGFAESKSEKPTLTIFDTTLRDGEQSPGATMNIKEKITLATQLSKLGVDVCEAGFPIASDGDFEAVKLVAQEVGSMIENRRSGKPMRICGLSRAIEKDIARCYEAVKHAPLHRIHTFLATSDIHLKNKLRISREECIKQSVHAVTFARSLVDDVEFSAEDAGRSDPAFMAELFGEVIKAGVSTINVPDTVGFVTPREYGELISYLKTNTPGGDSITWSTHCHNDLGLAVANTLEGVIGGARQVEVTINGIGERAGNASLEEVVMALYTRPQVFPVQSAVDTTQITRTSRMVTSVTGMSVQPNKAIVGANAFAHEAGIHQDGVLKHAATYEIMSPASVGLKSTLVLGKHSGKHAFQNRLEELGFDNLSPEVIKAAFKRFKDVADQKKTVTDGDIEAILESEVSCGHDHPTATVSITTPSGKTIIDASTGGGPVEAVYNAISRVVRVPIRLVQFHVEAVSEGRDAIGKVSVRVCRRAPPSGDEEALDIHDDEVTYHGTSAHVDIIRGSAEAFMNALNKMVADDEENELQRKEIEFWPGRVVINPEAQTQLAGQ
ncbi:hypothetical protein AAMO2058_000812400 [Amorphochlora amoebiformis]